MNNYYFLFNCINIILILIMIYSITKKFKKIQKIQKSQNIEKFQSPTHDFFNSLNNLETLATNFYSCDTTNPDNCTLNLPAHLKSNTFTLGNNSQGNAVPIGTVLSFVPIVDDSEKENIIDIPDNNFKTLINFTSSSISPIKYNDTIWQQMVADWGKSYSQDNSRKFTLFLTITNSDTEEKVLLIENIGPQTINFTFNPNFLHDPNTINIYIDPDSKEKITFSCHFGYFSKNNAPYPDNNQLSLENLYDKSIYGTAQKVTREQLVHIFTYTNLNLKNFNNTYFTNDDDDADNTEIYVGDYKFNSPESTTDMAGLQQNVMHWYPCIYTPKGYIINNSGRKVQIPDLRNNFILGAGYSNENVILKSTVPPDLNNNKCVNEGKNVPLVDHGHKYKNYKYTTDQTKSSKPINNPSHGNPINGLQGVGVPDNGEGVDNGLSVVGLSGYKINNPSDLSNKVYFGTKSMLDTKNKNLAIELEDNRFDESRYIGNSLIVWEPKTYPPSLPMYYWVKIN